MRLIVAESNKKWFQNKQLKEELGWGPKAAALEVQAFLDGATLSAFCSARQEAAGQCSGARIPPGMCLPTKAVLRRDEHSPAADFVEVEMGPIF